MSVDEKEWKQTLSQYSAAAASSAEKQPTAAATVEGTTSVLPSAEEALVDNNKEEVEVVVLPHGKKEGGSASAARPADATVAASSEAEVFRIQGDNNSNNPINKKSNETALVKAAAAPTRAIANNNNNMSSTDGTMVDNSNNNNNNNTTDALRAAGKIEANVKEWGVVTLEVQEIVGNVCVVFPSAITFPAEAATRTELATGHVPYVTLHPSFLKKKGTGNTAKALDNIFRAVSSTTSSSGFLSNDFLAEEMLDEKSDAVEKSCLGRLRALLHHAADNKAQVLLFLVLLVRIEVAVYLAFRKTLHYKKDDTAPAGNNNSPDLLTPGRLDTDKLEALVGQLENLSGLAQTLDKSKLNSIMGPMISTGHCSLGGNRAKASDAKIQNLLLTPLPALIRIFSTAEASNRPTFKAWDTAWTNSIRRLSEYAKSYPVQPKETTNNNRSHAAGSVHKTHNTHNDNTDWMDSTTTGTNPSLTAVAGSGSKKKRKTQKRRRRKKNNNGNNNNNNNNSTVDASTPNKDDANKSFAKDESGKANAADETKQEATKKKAGNGQPKENKSTKDKDASAKGGGTPPAVPHAETHTKRTAKEVQMPVASQMGVASAQKAHAEGSGPNKKAAGFDTKVLPISLSEETASTRSESTKHDDIDAESENKGPSKEDLSVSRVHGVGTVVVAPSSTADATKPAANADVAPEATAAKPETTANGAPDDDNGDEWETVVGGKGRGNRKKTGRATAVTQQPPATNTTTTTPQNTNAKKSKARRTKESRKRVANGKMVREILSSVLDSVDEEVKRRRQQQAAQARTVKNGSANNNKAPPSAWKEANRRPGIPAPAPKKDATMRDVVLAGGAQPAAPANKITAPGAKPDSGNVAKNTAPQNAGQKPSPSARTTPKNMSASPAKGAKGQAAGADQNTAPTIPETVSAVSDPRRTVPSKDIDITRSDSSSTGTDDNRKQEDQAAVPTKKNASPAPPLPTLLSPGNANSASSSVASSLEAPHASHGRHHTSTSNEADVGYHLLDVCDRLTRDMHMFMAHRAAALNARRRERGALLAALQDSVSNIWSGHSHVELYGSCATMLDLPSSDLDVVVCGLDHMDASMGNQPSPQKNGPGFNHGDNLTPDKMTHDRQQHRHSHMAQYHPMHLNADRVMRLAAELEHQPWAAHVKAIPTASVPVVKVLADPSRLPGVIPHSTVDGEEWMMQQHQGTEQNLPPGQMASVGEGPQAMGSQANGAPFEAPMPAYVWRGADVINGLLKLDITFEGPEHGGIGSTEFSARVIQNVCEETGLAAESTAFVQVVLVVKELLAQRRLNEPFSGGLSSYALLLLVLAVLCERKVIGEELERVERQRRVVAAGGGNSELAGTPSTEKKQAEEILSQQVQSQSKAQNQSVPPSKTKAPGDTTLPEAFPSNKSGNSNPSPKATHQANANQNGKQQKQPKQHQQSPAQQEKRAPTGNQQWGGKNQKGTPPTGRVAAESPATAEKKPAKSPGNSWASIAMGKKNNLGTKSAVSGKNQGAPQKKSPQPTKPSSFADAVARNAGGSPHVKAALPTAAPATPVPQAQPKQPNEAPATKGGGASANNQGKKNKQKHPQNQNQNAPSKSEEQSKNLSQKNNNTKKSTESVVTAKQQNRDESSKETATVEPERKIEADEKTSKFNNYSSEPVESSVISANQSVFPQGFNDVIEVLCSGETTPGKLLMHVLLFYGQHFDAHATAIDISGKHHREIATQCPPYTHLSPYIHRRSAGNIDPVTGMLTVDPIVVYDPLEGAENNNVARRCFLWSSVKWTFAQSYMTLSSAVERNTTPPGTPGSGAKNEVHTGRMTSNARQGSNNVAAWNGPYNPSDKESFFDPSSPLLGLLLSFK